MKPACGPDASGRSLPGLSEGAADALRSIGFELRYPTRFVFLSEGEQAKGIVLLRMGSAKISMSLSEGRAVILGIEAP